LLLIERGAMRWELPTGCHEVEAGSLCLIVPGVKEARWWTKRVASRHGFVLLRFTREAADGLQTLGVPPFRGPDESRAARAVFRRLLARIASPGFVPTVALAELRLVLALYLDPDQGDVEHLATPCHPVVSRAMRDLQMVWGRTGMRRVSLREWAAAIGCTPEHLCRCVRSELDCTPGALMQYMRTLQALHLIRAADLRMKQIAQQLGFGNETHLARLLRRQYGMSPKALRRWMIEERRLPPPRLPVQLPDRVALFWDPDVLRLERSGGG
jgi:AraC-like DNA-binding protein